MGSRSVWIYLLAGVPYLLLNQVPSALALQPKCSDAKVYSRERVYSQGSQVRRLKNKSRALFPEGRGYLWEKEVGHLSYERGRGGDDKETLR